MKKANLASRNKALSYKGHSTLYRLLLERCVKVIFDRQTEKRKDSGTPPGLRLENETADDKLKHNPNPNSKKGYRP